jgi:hypothetical protein
MRTLIFLTGFILYSSFSFGQVSKKGTAKPDPNKKTMIVETSCGECNFDLDGKSCDLAIRMNGKAYFVDGASIHDFGDPHGKGGFCIAVRKAEVQGEIVNGRFVATYFKLLPVEVN